MAGLHAGLNFFLANMTGSYHLLASGGGVPQRALHHHHGRLLMSVLGKCAGSGEAPQGGSAAVEFAMLLPMMITLFFGVVETSLALVVPRRCLDHGQHRRRPDLAGQTTATAADISNVYSAAGTILYPYYDPAARPASRPSASPAWSMTAPAARRPRRARSPGPAPRAGTGTLTPASRSVGSTVTFSQPLMTTNGSVIMAEIAYNYASPTTKVITGAINMTNNFYTKPRRVAQIPSPTGGCP